ncbi:N-acetylmuramoyl-L-alanine amidase [Acidovorax sp. GBBC 3334]|uniref:N-acetylmuramoyl-L-alanine amidase n=1 Tax=Acidovorax sp. GBBC 3334 TaxID=2940496 RepID=UPI0023046DC1|nr:N-acetylmuramoyl-L-alanine amidase [Acidovorax sp. GBBC 3334]MDA8456553.1 N-acetylmuramoyl-L-alanine amidase [Acidovorax sp. GBBC 3334]
MDGIGDGAPPCTRRAFFRHASRATAGAAALSVAACAQPLQPTPLRIDRSVRSESQDARVRHLVLHYTAAPLARSMQLLTEADFRVSAHYLVPEGEDLPVYQLVPEDRRAWHAGPSYWQGERMLNASSIGIEIVNPGFPDEDQALPPMLRRWHPYGEAQFQVLARLAAGIVARHGIRPTRVVGHSDIAPGRKSDPGPLFPWERLYREHGIGAWPDAAAVERHARLWPFAGDTASLQSRLQAYGYDTPQTGVFDEATQQAVIAFQMHFRPARYDGVPDTETAAILDALLEKYRGPGRAEGAPGVGAGEEIGDPKEADAR